MAVDTNLFPEVSANMVILDLSKLSKPRQKIDIRQTRHMLKDTLKENKYRNASTRTIHDLKRSHEEVWKVESVQQVDLSTKPDLSKKTTNELLDQIREQQIELIKCGLCRKCKVTTQPKRSMSSKRVRNKPPRPPSPPRRPVHNRLVYPYKEPLKTL